MVSNSNMGNRHQYRPWLSGETMDPDMILGICLTQMLVWPQVAVHSTCTSLTFKAVWYTDTNMTPGGNTDYWHWHIL